MRIPAIATVVLIACVNCSALAQKSETRPEPIFGSQDGFPNDPLSNDAGPRTFQRVGNQEIRITILEPEGEPAAGALVVLWNNGPTELTLLPEWERPVAKSMPNRVVTTGRPSALIQGVTDEDGTLTLTEELLSRATAEVSLERGFLVWHSSGYATETTSPPHDGQVRLRPFGSIEGQFVVNGQPPTAGTVVATWESFPLTPFIMGLSSAEMQHVPPVFQARVAVAIDETGKFTFDNLPPGRIQFILRDAPHTMGFFDQLNDTNLITWATVSDDDSEPITAEFTARAVTGRIELTDSLYRELTRVTARPGGGTQVDQRRLSVMLSRVETVPVDLGGIAPANDPFSTSTEDTYELIRAAAVWGRPGGQREKRSVVMMAAVDENGVFEFPAIAPGQYAAGLMSHGTIEESVGGTFVAAHDAWAMIRDDIFELDQDAFDTPPLPNGPDGTTPPINLGEIELDDLDLPRARATNTFESTTFTETDDSESPLPVGEPVLLDHPGNGDSFPPSGNPLARQNPGYSGRQPYQPQDDAVIPGTDFADVTRDADGYFIPPGSRGPALAQDVPGSIDAVGNRAESIDPLDREIALIVARMIAAGDGSTKQQLLNQLQSAMTKKFDAEQRAREELIGELETRLQAAKQRVAERSKNKNRLVRENIQGLLSISEDAIFSEEPRGGGTIDLLPEENSVPSDRIPGLPRESTPGSDVPVDDLQQLPPAADEPAPEPPGPSTLY